MTAAIEEIGTVLATEGEWAWVEIARRGGCDACASSSACGLGTLASVFGRRAVRLRMRNAVNAQPGERVTLAIDQGSVATGATAVYGPPLVGLLGGAGIGEWLGGRAGLPVDGVALVLGVVGFTLGVVLARWVGRRPDSEVRYQPVLTRRLPG